MRRHGCEGGCPTSGDESHVGHPEWRVSSGGPTFERPCPRSRGHAQSTGAEHGSTMPQARPDYRGTSGGRSLGGRLPTELWLARSASRTWYASRQASTRLAADSNSRVPGAAAASSRSASRQAYSSRAVVSVIRSHRHRTTVVSHYVVRLRVGVAEVPAARPLGCRTRHADQRFAALHGHCNVIVAREPVPIDRRRNGGDSLPRSAPVQPWPRRCGARSAPRETTRSMASTA